MKNPWQTLDVKTIYDNPWIKVTHREVLNPSGGSGIYGVVHFKNIAIAIVPIDEEGYTWIVGQYRYALSHYSWEVPEGGGPLEVPPIDSAKRELLEETGITAKNWIEVGELHISNSVTDERGVIFVAKDLSFGSSQPEETEQLALKRIHLDEAVEMVLNRKITDAMAMVALLKVKMLRDRGLL